jgi:hypothetical protein
MERRSLLKSIIALLVPQQQQQPQAPGGKRDVLSHNECGDMSAGALSVSHPHRDAAEWIGTSHRKRNDQLPRTVSHLQTTTATTEDIYLPLLDSRSAGTAPLVVLPCTRRVPHFGVSGVFVFFV